MSVHLELKGDAWRQLLNCAARPDDAHAGRGRCPWTPAYKQHLMSLPPLHSKELVVPPLARVLLFGMSYMGQMATGVLCASAVQRVESLHVAPSGLDSFDVRVCKGIDVLSSAAGMPPPPPPPPPLPVVTAVDASCSSDLQHFTLANGAVVTLVVNHATLQLPTSGPALRALLLWGNYSHAFVMNPHKSCFFAWQLNKTAADTCIDLMGDLDDDMSTDERTRGQSCTESGCLWKVLTRFRDAEAPRLQLTQVQAWQSNAHKQGRLWMPKELVIDANDIVHRYPCMKEGCHNSSTGHQCVPGALSLLSRELVRRMVPQVSSTQGTSHGATSHL